MTMTGLRPKRSESAPCRGENTNCISAHTVPKMSSMSAARTVSLPRKFSTKRGSTGMITPIASMSSSTVTKTKANAACRCDGAASGARIGPGVRSSSGFARSIGIFLFSQGQADRRARQIEGFPQAVHEIALIGIGKRVGAGAEQHEARRAAFRLRDVVELEAAAGDGRRRMGGDGGVEPAV